MNDDLRRLEDLLVYPRETLEIEMKSWLDLTMEENKADLAQAMLALANHGGGHVIIGYCEYNNTWIPCEPRPESLLLYSQDNVNGIIQAYAEPTFHCSVAHVQHPEYGLLFPIVVVPGGHRVPIRSRRDGPNMRHVKQNIYYIRGAGPSSRPIQSGYEWDAIINRCVREARDDLLEAIRSMLTATIASTDPLDDFAGGPTAEQTILQSLKEWEASSLERFEALRRDQLGEEQRSRYAHGFWTVSYSVHGMFAVPTLAQLLDVLRGAVGRETGWPPWWLPDRSEIAPYPIDGIIECWMKDSRFGDPAHSDFWRASRHGGLFLLRGYDEDSMERVPPGTTVDLVLPIWRVGECLLHAARFTQALGMQEGSIAVRCSWRGLAGRTLESLLNPRRWSGRQRISRTDTVTSTLYVPEQSLLDTLPEQVLALTRPLYNAFGFFDPPMSLMQEELARLREKRR